MLLGVPIVLALFLVTIFVPGALIAFAVIKIGQHLVAARARGKLAHDIPSPGYMASSVRTAEAALSENTASMIPVP